MHDHSILVGRRNLYIGTYYTYRTSRRGAVQYKRKTRIESRRASGATPTRFAYRVEQWRGPGEFTVFGRLGVPCSLLAREQDFGGANNHEPTALALTLELCLRT